MTIEATALFKKCIVLLFLGLLLLPGARVAAQDEGEAAAEGLSPAELRQKLADALDKAEDAEFSIRGSATIRQPAGGSMFGGGVMIAGLGASGEPYQGDFEAWSDEEGALVVLSEKELPGFGAYRSDDRDVFQMTYEEDAPDISQLMNDLGALLDMSRLRKWLKRSELTAEIDLETGVVTYEGEAPRRLVPSNSGSGMMARMNPKILKVGVKIVLSSKGALASAEFSVQRSDPMAAMMKGRGGRPGMGGMPGAGEMPAGDEGEDAEGTTAVYALTWVAGGPSPRAKKFRRFVEALLAQEEK